MRAHLLLCVLMLVACSKSPTSPAGHDPSVQVTNLTPRNVLLIWATDTKFDTLAIAPNATTCEVWTQVADSVYYILEDTLTVNGRAASTSSSPWLHVSDYAPFYVDTVLANANGYTQTSARVGAPCA